MGSHVGAIGIPADGEAFADHVHRLMSAAELLGTTPDERVRVYRYIDPTGSYITATVEESRLTCLTPGVVPGMVIAGTVGALYEFDCPYERPLELHTDLAAGVPLPVTIDDLAISEARFGHGQPISLELSALAERLQLFADEAAYRASGTPMAVESLIPAGLFAVGKAADEPHQVTSHILLSGTVASAELRRHAMFDHPYAVLGVQSLGGVWPVAVDRRDLGEDAALPALGSIVSATCWISGHPVE